MTPEQIKDALTNKFQLVGECEWHAFPGVPNQYSPRADIAIGEFSMRRDHVKTTQHNNALNNPHIQFFLEELYERHRDNVNGYIWDHVDAINYVETPEFVDINNTNFHINYNARCFIAFEFDNTSSNKHILGSMVNAAALGRIGICVADSDAAFNRFVTELNYLWFIRSVKQMNFEVRNLLIVTREQLETAITNLLLQP